MDNLEVWPLSVENKALLTCNFTSSYFVCKEMNLCFRRVVDHLPSALAIGTKALESVDAHKVLGVTIQSNLKWDLHINEVVPKASKRLHILRVLKRGGVPPANLLEVYFALIRSSSSFSCSVTHGILL